MNLEFKKWFEDAGAPYIGKCVNTKDYIVFGACSDQKKKKKVKN